MSFPNAVINGTPVVFSLGSAAGVTNTGLSGNLTQSISLEKQTKRTIVNDGNGNRTTSVHSDPIKVVSLEYKVGGTGIANAILNTTLVAPGTFITITAAPNMPELVSSNGWEVLKPRLKEGNEEVATITMDIEQAPNITGPAAS